MRGTLVSLLLVFAAATEPSLGQDVVTFSGRVVAADTDGPVRRAMVLVWGANTRTLRAVFSDDNGAFSIADLPADTYRAGASKPPFLPAVADADASEIVIRLARGAAIAGTITTAEGMPVTGVSVTARGSGTSHTVTTDDRGQYRLHSLPADEYTIAADRAAAPATVAVVAGDDRQDVNFIVALAPTTAVDNPGGPSSIAGTLVDRETHTPIDGAIVGLSGPLARQTVTDARGAFTFRDLPFETYTVRVEDPRYRAIGISRIAPTPDPVTGVSLRAVRLASLTGRLHDDAGDAAVDVTVLAFRRTVLGLHPMLVPKAHATTDDRGEYWIGGLPDGEYIVCACGRPAPSVDESHVAALTGGRATAEQIAALVSQLPVMPAVFYPGRRTTSNAVVVALESGDERFGIDISLFRVPARRITGRLISPDGRVLQRATIRLLSSGDIPEAVALTEIEPAVLSPQGEFTFSSVPEGDYTLAAFSLGNDTTQFAATPVSVGNQDVTGLTLTMTTGATLQGRVDLAGGANMERGSSTPRVSLLPLVSPVYLVFAGTTGRVGHSADVEPDGTFSVEGLPSGRYVVTATGFPSPWHRIESIASADSRSPEPVIDITDGSQSMVVTLAAEEMATMSGRVELPLFESPDTARVVIFPADPRTWPALHLQPSRVQTANIDTRLQYEITGIPPGEYVAVVVRTGEFEMTPRTLERLAARGERVTLNAGDSDTRTLSGR